MKLIFCIKCQDVIKMQSLMYRTCDCGASWGKCALDGINVEYGGKAIPLGFSNISFAKAIKKQPETDAAGGEPFTAFVIPKVCDTCKRVEQ